MWILRAQRVNRALMPGCFMDAWNRKILIITLGFLEGGGRGGLLLERFLYLLSEYYSMYFYYKLPLLSIGHTYRQLKYGSFSTYTSEMNM